MFRTPYYYRVFPGVGTVINIIAILLGTLIGKIGGNRFPERTRNLITDVLGAITLISAAAAIKELWSPELTSSTGQGGPVLIVLVSLILGALFGSVLDIDAKLVNLGENLKRRFGSSDNRFVEGFVTASLIFAIGPLAILGSISDGMASGIEQLLLKSTLDFFAAIAFSSAFGIGVLLSILPVGIYQGIWTAIGFSLGGVLTDAQMAVMTAVGGVLLLGIGFKLLNLKSMAVGNLLPALALAPIVFLVFQA